MLERLKRKYETPVNTCLSRWLNPAGAKIGVIALASTEPAIQEACFLLAAKASRSTHYASGRIPMSSKIGDFIRQHERNYVVEMNRDGQLHQLLTLEFAQDGNEAQIYRIYGWPAMTARFVSDAIQAMEENNMTEQITGSRTGVNLVGLSKTDYRGNPAHFARAAGTTRSPARS